MGRLPTVCRILEVPAPRLRHWGAQARIGSNRARRASRRRRRMSSACLTVLLALVNALAGPLFGARRHPLGELRAVFGYPPISAVGESGKPRESGCREPTSRQERQERCHRGASRAPLAGRRDQVPRGHPRSGRELSEQVDGLGSLQRDRVQARRAIPPQQAGQQPLAEAALRVVKDRPAVLGGQSDGVHGEVRIACHAVVAGAPLTDGPETRALLIATRQPSHSSGATPARCT